MRICRPSMKRQFNDYNGVALKYYSMWYRICMPKLFDEKKVNLIKPFLMRRHFLAD
jgi:hypothetical protein